MNNDERFFSFVKYSEDCWSWLGTKSQKGYGSFSIKNKTVRAHRWAYEYFIGPLGKLHCCHHCDNPSCVSPWHLFSGTNKDNIRDAAKKNRLVVQHYDRHPNRLRTHCKRGHEFTEENTYVSTNGRWRSCRICHRMHWKNMRDRKKEVGRR